MEDARISLLVEEERRYEQIGPNTSALTQQTAGGWKASSLILFVELCLSIANFGITRNLVVYLKTQLLEDNFVAAAHVSAWVGTCFLTTLIGAYVSDSYLGNYSTIIGSGVIYLIGLVTLTLSASLSILKHSTFITFLGLYLISLGMGPIKPCISSFGADQFDNTDTKAKASFFSYYYMTISMAIFFASTVIVWLQDNYGWTIGFGILTLGVCIAFIGFMTGSGYYRCRKPRGSPFTSMCQVLVAASRKCNLNFPEDTSLYYQEKGKLVIIQDSEELKNNSIISFLDKAAIITSSDFSSGAVNPWNLCTMSQVEELKSILRLLPIWATFIPFSMVTTLGTSVYVEQGMVMNRSFGSLSIPAPSLTSITVLTVIVFTLIFDKIIIPIARRFTKTERGLSHLQRAGIGLFFSILVLSAASIVEAKRLQIARDAGLVHEKVAVPMSIFWQIPQYVLMGIAEVFNQIGMLQFFYDQAPDSMRSVCQALALLTISLGSYVNSLILAVVNRFTGWIPENLNEGHLDRYFLLVAGLCSFNLFVFIYFASNYRYKRK